MYISIPLFKHALFNSHRIIEKMCLVEDIHYMQHKLHLIFLTPLINLFPIEVHCALFIRGMQVGFHNIIKLL